MEPMRNRAIDLLKGVCILFVVITHFSWTANERLMLGFPFWINMAIPIFMLVAGYVNTLSYLRKNITGLDQAFSVKNWLKSFVRYTLPFLIIFALESIYHLVLGTGIVWYEYLAALLSGGWGPGSYFFPIMVQFLIVFPFIFKIIQNTGGGGKRPWNFIPGEPSLGVPKISLRDFC
ncbi:MAG: hypothetical protein NC133_02670 [Prevotella sp.]|nr:hypothetical protein [Prevotella sp.]